ncbi:sugar ABC transporter permease [Candidatus Aerophobetes bacterium]|nr:sugar ABC transporter permease [Candidatus Aerophobetes bacterium]
MTDKRSAILFILPAILVLVTISVVPTIRAVTMSFQNRELRYESYSYIGFDNYKKLFSDRRFINSIKVSASWELITVSCTMAIAICLSFFLFEYVPPRAKKLMQTLLILPAIVPRVSAAYIWRYIYSPIVGPINFILGLIHIRPVALLSDPQTALLSVAVVDTWQWATLFSVIILGILESLPREPLEAARIDGASNWQVHRYIAFPCILPSLLSLTFVKMVESLRSFDLIYIMTKGGPGISTETLDLYAYTTGIGLEGRISYASGMAVLMLVGTIISFTIIWNLSQGWTSK